TVSDMLGAGRRDGGLSIAARADSVVQIRVKRVLPRPEARRRVFADALLAVGGPVRARGVFSHASRSTPVDPLRRPGPMRFRLPSLLVLALSGTALLGGCSASITAPSDASPDPVVATFGNETVTLADFEDRYALALGSRQAA